MLRTACSFAQMQVRRLRLRDVLFLGLKCKEPVQFDGTLHELCIDVHGGRQKRGSVLFLSACLIYDLRVQGASR